MKSKNCKILYFNHNYLESYKSQLKKHKKVLLIDIDNTLYKSTNNLGNDILDSINRFHNFILPKTESKAYHYYNTYGHSYKGYSIEYGDIATVEIWENQYDSGLQIEKYLTVDKKLNELIYKIGNIKIGNEKNDISDIKKNKFSDLNNLKNSKCINYTEEIKKSEYSNLNKIKISKENNYIEESKKSEYSNLNKIQISKENNYNNNNDTSEICDFTTLVELDYIENSKENIQNYLNNTNKNLDFINTSKNLDFNNTSKNLDLNNTNKNLDFNNTSKRLDLNNTSKNLDLNNNACKKNFENQHLNHNNENQFKNLTNDNIFNSNSSQCFNNKTITDLTETKKFFEKDIGIYAFTNASAKISERQIKALGLSFIDGIFCCQYQNFGSFMCKPDPEIYNFIEDLFELEGENIFLFEDREINLKPAKERNWKTFFIDDDENNLENVLNKLFY